MKRCLASALLLVCVNTATTAATAHAAAQFGTQLDCTTKKALNSYHPSMSEVSRVRRAVDSCMSRSMPNEARIVRASARTTLAELEARREDMVDATMRRLQLCRDTGISAANFGSACPQLFLLERVAAD